MVELLFYEEGQFSFYVILPKMDGNFGEKNIVWLTFQKWDLVHFMEKMASKDC